MRTLLTCSLPLVLLLATTPAPARADGDPSDTGLSVFSPADGDEHPLTRLSWRVARNWRRATNPLDEPVGPVVSPFLPDVSGALHSLTRHGGGPLSGDSRGFLQSVLEHGFSVAPRGQKLVAWALALLEEEKEGGALPGPALPEHGWIGGLPGGGGGGGMGRGSMPGGGGSPGGGGGGMGAGSGGSGGGGSGGGSGGGAGAGSLVGGAQGGTGGGTGGSDPGTGSSSSGSGSTLSALGALGSGSGGQGSQSAGTSPGSGISSSGGTTPSGGSTSLGGATPSGGTPSGSSVHPNVGPSAPEIDPGGAAGALAVLVGGVLLLTDRLRRKA